MNTIKSALFSIFFLFAPLHASIQVTDTLADVVDICDRDALVIFDLDNTLIRSLTKEGTDEWFFETAQALIKEGKTKREAWDIVIPIYTAAQCTTKVQFVENITPEILTELRTRKIRTIALTSRGRTDLFTATFRQLADLGITFEQSDSAWQQTFILEPLRGETRYQNGVIFCDGNDKGAALENVLKRLDCHPTKIIFFDDSLSNLQAVERLAQKLQINFYGFHYLRVQHGLLDHPVVTPSYGSSAPSTQQETSVQ